MQNPSSMLLILAALGILGALGYAYVTRQADDRSTATSAPAAGDPEPTADSRPTATDAPPAVTPAPADARSPQNIDQWIADTGSDDPKIRAAAIVALGQAPKSQAVPALAHVLETGERDVDRQIALQSLHSIALAQGDEDGGIRKVLRAAVYHGDDDGVSQSAQAVLEDIETALAERANVRD